MQKIKMNTVKTKAKCASDNDSTKNCSRERVISQKKRRPAKPDNCMKCNRTGHVLSHTSAMGKSHLFLQHQQDFNSRRPTRGSV